MTLKEIARVGKKRGFSLEAMGVYKPPTMPENTRPGRACGRLSHTFREHACQLLVDTEPRVKIERYIACHDVGKAINPDRSSARFKAASRRASAWLDGRVVMKDGRIMNRVHRLYSADDSRRAEIECIILENPTRAARSARAVSANRH